MTVQRLNHVAYRCRDAKETTEFYVDVLGLPLAHTIVQDRVPSTQEYAPHAHIFFELGDGSYLAFFDVPSAPEDGPDASPWWVKHIAFETDSMPKLLAAKARLEKHGVQALGPKDHDFCQSIYFMDPDGHRLEITVRTEQRDTWDRLEIGRAHV